MCNRLDRIHERDRQMDGRTLCDSIGHVYVPEMRLSMLVFIKLNIIIGSGCVRAQ